jgi:hypothetical protein
MSLGGERRQKSRQLELLFEGRGEAPTVERSGEAPRVTKESGRSGNDGEDLMALVVEPSNVEAALRRVVVSQAFRPPKSHGKARPIGGVLSDCGLR